MSDPVLRIRHLRTRFRTRLGDVDAVDDVSFDVHRGETVAVVGESGSGKSVTALSVLQLLDSTGSIAHGSIEFIGHDLVGIAERELRALRGRDITMIFQDPATCLDPVFTIEDQITEALEIHGTPSSEAKDRALELLRMVRMPDPQARLSSYPHQLSGGQRQRAMIAMALAMNPKLIIADEPTTALDVTIQAQILSEIQQLARRTGTSLIWISHDLSVVAGLVDTVAVMYAGRIIEIGPVNEILDQPQHPYTQGLIDSIPSSNEPGQRLRQIPGTTPAMANLPPGCAFAPRCPRAQPKCADSPQLLPVRCENGSEHPVRCFFPGPVAPVAEVQA